MANFGTFVMRPKEDTARDKLIPRKLVRQSRGDTKDEDVICHHSAHCRQILSIKTPLSSPSNSRIIWHVAAVACVCVKRMRFVYVCVTSDRTISNMATWPLRPRHDVNLLRGGGGASATAFVAPSNKPGTSVSSRPRIWIKPLLEEKEETLTIKHRQLAPSFPPWRINRQS